MTHHQMAIRQNIAWLRSCSGALRMTPLGPFWWPLITAWEAAADMQEQVLAAPSGQGAESSAEIIILDHWRRRAAAGGTSRHSSRA